MIDNPELSGTPINSIRMMAPENKDLLVHSRDNCIRILDYQTN